MKGDVATMLRRQGMPGDEVREVLTTDDPDLVRIRLELHRERLDEHLLELRRTVDRVERSLIDAIGDRWNSSSTR